ncbi:MAG: DUF5658 family protein [Gammaproteobacteria bacterium]|jgi:hypothetical protein
MDREPQATSFSFDAASGLERRNRPDRRRHSWRTLTYCGLRDPGRRRNLRRRGHSYYLDWYEPKLVFTGLAVLVMSCLDALFTLALLENGAYEANYLMARLLEVSNEVFVWSKVAITGIGVMFLLMHAQFRVFGVASGKTLLQLTVPVYGVLIVYELLLLGALVE